MGFIHYGVNTGGLPVDYVRLFADAYGIEIFFETGTAGGDSVRAASSIFKECHTIEIVEGRADGEYPPNVFLYQGNSAELLRDKSAKFKGQRIFFWLDAHWSEPYPAPLDANGRPTVNECPILEEIEAISDHQEAMIMIDDARLFYGPPPSPCDPRSWPSIMQIFLNLHKHFPTHIISIVDDYIICYPDTAKQPYKDVFNAEWLKRFDQRYPSDTEKLKQSVRLAYSELKKFIE